MADQGFNQAQIEQLRTIVREEVRPIVREEVKEEVEQQIDGPKIRQVIRDEVREEFDRQLEGPKLRSVIREEVRSEVTKQVQPLHQDLKEFREEAREDADSLNSVQVNHGARIQRLESFAKLEPIKQS